MRDYRTTNTLLRYNFLVHQRAPTRVDALASGCSLAKPVQLLLPSGCRESTGRPTSPPAARGRHAFLYLHLLFTLSMPFFHARADRNRVVSVALGFLSWNSGTMYVLVFAFLCLVASGFWLLFERNTDRLRVWVCSRIGLMSSQTCQKKYDRDREYRAAAPVRVKLLISRLQTKK